MKKQKSGFVSIVGAPNVGKSTFLNQVLEFKLAITSDKPQTTRNRLLGVYNQPDLQVVFLDTPGLHESAKALNRMMVRTAMQTLADVDVVLFMVEASERGLDQAAKLVPLVKQSGLPAVLALNKIDMLNDKRRLLPMLETAGNWGQWRALVPISARKGEGCRELIKELAELLPQAPPVFPSDMLTDLSERFLCGELIREKVFRFTHQELPYGAAVTVEEFLEPGEEGRTVAITATIHVERDSQKAMVIGKGGAMIKMIGTAARRDMETLLGRPVFLDLLVRVEPGWSRDRHGLAKLGYQEKI